MCAWKIVLCVAAASGCLALPCSQNSCAAATTGADDAVQIDNTMLLQVQESRRHEKTRGERGPFGNLIKDLEAGMQKGAGGQGDAPSALTWGPLNRLIGKWESTRGINSMSLPKADPTDLSGFLVLVQQYRETLEFEPILGSVLNRGYKNANQLSAVSMENQTLMGLTYKLKIHDLKSGNLLHEETGQWLWNMVPGTDTNWEVSRVGIIPHGVVVVALGSASETTGAQVVREQQAMQSAYSIDPRAALQLPAGYFEGKLSKACPCRGQCPCKTSDGSEGGCPSTSTCMRPVERLVADIGEVVDMKVSKFEVSVTHPGGSLSQLPNIKKQVFNSAFNATFWVQSPTGGKLEEDYTQLQYAQTVNMAFKCIPRLFFPCARSLIEWPHVQVNTLRKVAKFSSETH